MRPIRRCAASRLVLLRGSVLVFRSALDRLAKPPSANRFSPFAHTRVSSEHGLSCRPKAAGRVRFRFSSECAAALPSEGVELPGCASPENTTSPSIVPFE